MSAAFEIAHLFRRDLTHFEYGSHGHTTRRRSHFSTFLQFFDAIIPEETPRRTLAFVHRVERSDVQCVRH